VYNSVLKRKIYQTYLAGSVPVYMGAPNVGEFVPFPNSFINAADFESAKDLAVYLSRVITKKLIDTYRLPMMKNCTVLTSNGSCQVIHLHPSF